MFALCTWLYDIVRGSTWLYRFFGVCWPCARSCTPLFVDPHHRTGPFRRVGLVHEAVGLSRLFDVAVPVLLGVLALWTRLYAPARGSTRPYRPLSACSPCAGSCTPLDTDPSACTGPIGAVGHVHVAVGLRRLFHVAVPAILCGFALCTWLYSPGRGSTCL